MFTTITRTYKGELKPSKNFAFTNTTSIATGGRNYSRRLWKISNY